MSLDPAIGTELIALLARCSRAMDSGDADEFARCFDPEGSLVTSSGLRILGRDELTAFAASWYAGRARATRHVTSEHRFAAGDDVVVGTCAIVVEQEPFDADSPPLLRGHYDDVYARSEERWTILRRTVRVP